MRALRFAACLAALLAAACTDAGSDRILTVSATGIVKGLIYFDLDGNKIPNVGDDSVKNIKVKLVSKASGDSVAGATTDIHGDYRMANVPVGLYRLVIDTAILADTAIVSRIDSAELTVKPAESTLVGVAISYPLVSIRQARTTIPLGHKVFIEGVALNSQGTYRDTTIAVQDTSAAIRAGRMLTTGISKSDSVRMRGTIVNNRPGGQRTLDIVTVILVKPFAVLPTVTNVTTAQASSAVNGTRDAQLLQVLNATITDTLTVNGDFRVTVNDGSGALEVLLDATSFPQVIIPTLQVNPGNKFDFVGVATPTVSAGIWRLKPRDAGDLTKH